MIPFELDSPEYWRYVKTTENSGLRGGVAVRRPLLAVIENDQDNGHCTMGPEQ
jgi:hypothetical protein